MERAYSNFVDSLENESTRYVYDLALKQYMAWSKQASYDKLAKVKSKAMEDKIAKYIKHLKDKKYAPLSIRMKIAPLKQFFVMNRVTLNWPWVFKFIPGSRIATKDRPYTKEEVRKILDKCDNRERVMFLLLLSTGMRIGALPYLKIRDLKKWEEYGVYQVLVYDGEPDSYTTFTTAECAKAIDSYLAFRQSRGETLQPGAPLIREQFVEANANEAKPAALTGIRSILSRTLVDAGVRVKGKDSTKRKEVMAFHGFRKYFATALNKAGAKPAIRELLLGHQSSRGLDKNYLRPADDELIGEYMKALELLTVSEEKELQAKVQRLTEEKDEQHNKEMQELEVRLTAKFMGMLRTAREKGEIIR